MRTIKYEAVLDNATECPHPDPPYAKKRSFISTFTIRKIKKRTVLSGQHRVLAEIPFTNLSINTYKMEAGKMQLIIRFDKIDCRSWMGRMFMAGSDIPYSRKTCQIQKGLYIIKDFDINKASHSMPHWKAVGSFLYRTQIVHNASTVLCLDIMATFKEL
ncbi:uncharacterized protein LOC125229358 [Leguminivora glycinivorella]|uniref:uncharacterized protein LOC125229358 n=1 Tax=Leguminivora glycinivorella TaxID=1035111 RepID=UPI00200BC8EE|nr:uncharacterized protein LOC125229358 [Leguminivora glycinivorella]